MVEQTELRGTPVSPTGQPNAKGTAKIAPGIAVLGNPAFFLVVLVVLGITSHLGLFGQPFPS